MIFIQENEEEVIYYMDKNGDYWDGAGNAWQGKIEASLDGGSTWSYMLCITGDDAHVKMLPASRATELCARVRAMV